MNTMNIIKHLKEKKIEKLANKMLMFLKKNNINNWSEYENMSHLDKYILYEVIIKEIKKNYRNEVFFIIRLELSNQNQLDKFLIEMEKEENCFIRTSSTYINSISI